MVLTFADLPAKGELGRLLVVQLDASALACPLIDTPDLDGDQPGHPLQADRAFRWAQRTVFVVTPEKYQMTELLPYYRLARRYELPCLFVMNKCEEPAVVEDFRRQLAERGWPDAAVFVVPRDDAAYDAPVESNLAALQAVLNQPATADPGTVEVGRQHRVQDAVGRLGDQVIAPLQDARRSVDELLRALAAMESPAAGVDVNPITVQLQRRLQQRSVLYLIGPQRVLDRLRQMPTLLARLPRASWDWIVRGQMPADLDPKAAAHAGDPPDFPAILGDQFTVVRSRIDDVLRSSPVAPAWLAADPGGYAAALLPPATAAAIATEEIAELTQWLQTRWNATPRDTKMLQSLLKYLPGGQKLTKWTEAAPYLLTIAVVAHHAIFGHVDLLVLGGYSLATWLTEKLSNEVGNRTRRTNRRIGERFEKLAHQQIRSVADWLDHQAPSRAELEQLEQLAAELATAAG